MIAGVVRLTGKCININLRYFCLVNHNTVGYDNLLVTTCMYDFYPVVLVQLQVASFKLPAARFLQKMCRSCPLFYRGKTISVNGELIDTYTCIILFCSTYSLSGSVITNEHTFSSHSVVEGHKCIVRHRYLPTDREAIPPGKLVCLTLVKRGSLIANFFINGVLKF